MTTTIDHNKADVSSRPNARFDGDGQLEIRASAAGNALEPVVLRAMERAGWEVTPADPQDPQQVSVQVGPNMLVTGHPDATGVLPLFGGEAVVEVKTRGPEAFKRWRTLGGERSHPASVAQAAFYTLGTFGELRDAVIATMDTGSRQWDYEVIPPPSGWDRPWSGPPSGSVSWALTSSSTGRTPTPCRNGTTPPRTGSASPVPS